jgi:CTP synthase
MCVEFARHVLQQEHAHSTEVDPSTPYPVISLLSEQRGIDHLGGTMRLGAYPCVIRPHTKAAKAYGTLQISERHRHRFEFNNAYKESFEKAGLLLSVTL